MPTIKQLSRIMSKDDSLNRVQDQLASALNPILRNVQGDLTGPLESPTVVGFQGYPVSSTAPVYGASFAWNGSKWYPFPHAYGAFSSATTQNLPLFSAGTPLAVAAENTDIKDGVTVQSDGSNLTRFTVPTDGVYEISFSAQSTITGGASTNFYNWLRHNGVDVADSGSEWQLGNNNKSAIPYNSIIHEMKANDYVQWMFAVDTIAATPALTAIGAVVGPPARPANPSIIVNVRRIAI